LSIIKSLTTNKVVLKLIDSDLKKEIALKKSIKPSSSTIKIETVNPKKFKPAEWKYYKVLRDNYKLDLIEYRR
jgi:predicted AAA+ superfamily ATPase